MKKKIVHYSLIGLALSLALGTPLIFSGRKAEKVDGYSTSTLPTTIDLNDTSAANIRSYYSSLNSLATNQRQGNNLLKNLKTILKNGQKYYSYDSGNAIWQIYEIADRDWSKSPASSTTYGTYNSGTNKITNYTYGTSSSSSKNNPYIHALYINRNVTNQTTAWDDHQQTQWGINREHVWPKAEGFETSGAGGARGDPMHLMAGNGYANNIHSNYYYGYVNTSSSYTNCGSKYSNVSGNLLGKSKTLGGSTNVFEPQDCDKGDIARAIFYMVARYNYLSSSDSDGIDSNNPNLALTQSLSDWASSGYSSTTSKQGKMGIMTDLLAWHHADPVDSYEIHRNNLLYTNYTNNRNPFIDFPEWADFIWGSVNYSGSTYVSNDTTPTGYATPSSDTINGYNSGGGESIAVTGVSVSPNSTSVEAGKDVTLTATVAPSNATNQGVSWTSSNPSIATVSGGIVTGVAQGSATITATTSDGGYTATCSVTVTASSGGESSGSTASDSASASDITSASSWTKSGTGTYSGGDLKFDSTNDYISNTTLFNSTIASGMTSLTVTINGKWNSGTGDATTNSYKVEAINSSGQVLATQTKTGSDVFTSSLADVVFEFDSDLTGCAGIKITYANKGNGNWSIHSVSWTATYSEEEQEATLSSIAVKTAPTKLTYTAGDDFTPAGLVITATYSDASTEDIEYSGNEDAFDFDPYDNLQTSDVSVTISYGGKTCTQAITVSAAKTLSSITINTENVTKSFYVDDTFEHENLVVTAHFSDSSTDVVSSSATVTTPDMSTAGEKTVTVSYTYGGTTKTAQYTISVIEGGSAVSGNYTWNLSIDSTSSASNTNLTWTSECATMSADKHEASTATNNYYPGTSGKSYTSTRFYANSKLTFTPSSNYEITSVVFTATQNSYATALANSTWTNATASASSSTVTITPADGKTAFYAVIGGTTGHSSVVVNYLYTPPAELSSITLDTTNVQTVFAVNDTFNYTGLVVTAHYSDSSSSVVTPTSVSSPNMSTTGQKSVTVTYEENDVSKSASYYITVNSNPTLTWTAPTINTFSGTSLTSTDTNSWGVTYNNGSGSTTNPTYGQFTVKLGGTTISLPYTWQPADDGKTLCVSYSTLTTSTTTVSIVQAINAVNMDVPGEPTTKTWNATSGCLGTAISSVGGTKEGTLTFDDDSTMSYTRTLEYVASGKADYVSFSSPYQQFGSSNALNTLVLEASNSAKVTQVVVTCWAKNGATNVSVTVGGSAFDSTKSAPSAAGSVTFTGEASGNIVITMEKAAKTAGCAQYIASVAITTASSSGGSTNIANVAGHEDAQRLAVLFAKTFNEFMDDTQNCTTGLSAAWASCSTAYTLFKQSAASLGETEEAWCLNLIKYATAQYSDDSGEACIERMMKTYEVCVQKHGQTAFMSDLVTLSSKPAYPLLAFSTKDNGVALIIIASVLSVSIIGGYFFLKTRKKEDF